MSVASSHGVDGAWVLPLTLCNMWIWLGREARTRSEIITQKSVIYCQEQLVLHSQQPNG